LDYPDSETEKDDDFKEDLEEKDDLDW